VPTGCPANLATGAVRSRGRRWDDPGLRAQLEPLAGGLFRRNQLRPLGHAELTQLPTNANRRVSHSAQLDLIKTWRKGAPRLKLISALGGMAFLGRSPAGWIQLMDRLIASLVVAVREVSHEEDF